MTNGPRIKFAYFLDGWSFEEDDIAYLKDNAEHVTPDDYSPDMHGHLFCPGCYTNLSRVPKDKDNTTNQVLAHFRHQGKYSHIDCDLRVAPTTGKRYESYEQAMKAINNKELVIVDHFSTDRPEPAANPEGDEEYQGPNEDTQGPLSRKPLGKHNGQQFELPSRATTVYGICRNFEKNLYKYYWLPGQKGAFLLENLLHDVKHITDPCDTPKLYWGRVTRSVHHGEHKRDDNIRMTYFNYPETHGHKDMCIKTEHITQAHRGIDDKSKGRIVLVYGKVTDNGLGLCFTKLHWGEIALLPTKYEYLLEDN